MLFSPGMKECDKDGSNEVIEYQSRNVFNSCEQRCAKINARLQGKFRYLSCKSSLFSSILEV